MCFLNIGKNIKLKTSFQVKRSTVMSFSKK